MPLAMSKLQLICAGRWAFRFRRASVGERSTASGSIPVINAQERQLDVTRRALSIPAPARQPTVTPRFPGEIEIGHIKAGPRQADATVGHGTDGLRNG